MRTETFRSHLLERRSIQSPVSQLSQAQLRLDAGVQAFSHEAGDVSNLLAMGMGSFAYRASKLGILSVGSSAPGLARLLAPLGGLCAEVTAFRGTHSLLTPSVSNSSTPWLSDFVTFASLKVFGHAARRQNVFLTHSLQSLGMVTAHQLTYALHLSAKPHGTFFEQLLEAERTNLALNAGNALMGHMTGHRLQRIEASMESRSRVFESRPEQRNLSSSSLSPQMASEAAEPQKILREEAVNPFWQNHLRPHGIVSRYFNKTTEARRLFRAFQEAEKELQGTEVSQKIFLDAVLKRLKATQGVSSQEYKTRYSILEAAQKFDRDLLSLAEEGQSAQPHTWVIEWSGWHSGELRGLYERHLARYRVEVKGGEDWGAHVDNGAPQKALQEARTFLPVHETGELISEYGGRSLEDRLVMARKILENANVKLVAVWGAGRHGLALGDWVRQAAGRGEKIDGKYVVPIMLGHRADFTHELNIDGTNEKDLPNIPINEAGRLALRAALPQENRAYLALADTVIVTLPSTKLKEAFVPELVRNLSGNTQLIFAIKSVLDKGESIPGYVVESLAKWGRFDLMKWVAFQSGLGFPKEMFGRNAPDAPVNLAVDAMTIEAAERAAKIIVGDRAQISPVSRNKKSLLSLNKRVDAGVLVFKGAYGGFIKNFVSPWVGYRLMDYYVTTLPRPTSAMMRSKLADLQDEAVSLVEQIFNQYEAGAIRREVSRIEKIIQEDQNPSQSEQKQQALDWVELVRNRLDKYRDRITGTEDLLGCTRIRDMDVYIRIVDDLLSARGLTFERRLEEFTRRVRSQASSTNFAYGLLEPVYLELVNRGLLVRRPVRDFTVEGINGLPNAAARWGERPEFVLETLAWVNPDPEPRGSPALHPSGLRRHALRVTLDMVNAMEEHTHAMIMNPMNAPAERLRVQEIINMGKEMLKRLYREKEEFPPSSQDLEYRIAASLSDFERFFIESERQLGILDYSKPEVQQALRKYAVNIRKLMLELRKQLEGSSEHHEEWIEEGSMGNMRKIMSDAISNITLP